MDLSAPGQSWPEAETSVGYTNQPESIEEADVVVRVVGELVGEFGGLEGGQEAEELGDCDAETDGVNLFGTIFLKDIGGEIESGAHFAEPSLFFDPVLVTAGVPAGEVVLVQGAAVPAELLEDAAIGEAVVEHNVDGVTDVFGESGDFAVSAVVHRQ